MKFEIKNSDNVTKEKPVQLSLKMGNSGDVDLMADGYPVLSIHADGHVFLYCIHSAYLSSLGFKIDGDIVCIKS